MALSSAHLLTLTIESDEWRRNAACRDTDPDLFFVGVAAGVTGIGSVLAVARAYWASSTRQVRSRIEDLMEAIERSVERPAQLPPDAGEHG